MRFRTLHLNQWLVFGLLLVPCPIYAASPATTAFSGGYSVGDNFTEEAGEDGVIGSGTRAEEGENGGLLGGGTQTEQAAAGPAFGSGAGALPDPERGPWMGSGGLTGDGATVKLLDDSGQLGSGNRGGGYSVGSNDSEAAGQDGVIGSGTRTDEAADGIKGSDR